MRMVSDLVLPIALVGTAVIALSIGVYAFGSFVLMRPHGAARSFSVFFRELVRETILAALTQPFLPLFYVWGRRMEPLFARRARTFASAVPVVFVHGYMQNRVGFVGLARALTRRGIGPLYGVNYPWFASFESNAKRLELFVDRVSAETKSPTVDLVCHSMGGLIAMEMLRNAKAEAASKVRRCVTIATPHRGVAWQGPLIGVGATNLRRGSKLLAAQAAYAIGLPTLSIYSTHDNIVYPKETSSIVDRGGRDIEVEGFAHLAILFSPKVAEHVATFLLEPDPSTKVVAVPAAAATPIAAPEAPLP